MNQEQEQEQKKQIPLSMLIIFFLFFTLLAVFALVQMSTSLKPYAAARKEYDRLAREYAPQTEGVDENEADTKMEPTNLLEINPDYIGWITIENAKVDYPIVQGKDNMKYLTTTFEGNSNKLGTLFMDYRCDNTFDNTHTIIYGHNAKNGSMFGSLSSLLSKWQGEEIIVTLPNGLILTYTIFDVRVTDVEDPVFQIVAEDLKDDHILTLSTCTAGDNEEERLIVRAKRNN